MKLLGLIGGMSWENTIEYYRIINQEVKSKLGGWNSAKMLFYYSVNFEEILGLEEQGNWEKLAKIFINISKKLESDGCKAIVLCSNTIYIIADEIQKAISIP